MKYKIYQVARYFYEKDPNMKFRKLKYLCWYSYSWYIYKNNKKTNKKLKKLFNEKAYGDFAGPTFRKLTKDYQKNLSKTKEAMLDFDKNVEKFLEEIYEKYSKIDIYELDEIINSELPYKNARKDLKPLDEGNELINDYDIFEEYNLRDINDINEYKLCCVSGTHDYFCLYFTPYDAKNVHGEDWHKAHYQGDRVEYPDSVKIDGEYKDLEEGKNMETLIVYSNYTEFVSPFSSYNGPCYTIHEINNGAIAWLKTEYFSDKKIVVKANETYKEVVDKLTGYIYKKI